MIDQIPASLASPANDSGEAGAPANEIEITPEMIEAGKEVFASVWLEFISDRGSEMWAEVLADAYRAMMAVAP